MNISWNLYKLFYYVAYYGSTSAASKELMIAQPSISMSIKQLEKQLGCSLFYRSYSGMVLTEHGKILYEHIKKAVEHIEEAEDYVKYLVESNKNTISIAVIDTTLQFFLSPYLEQFKEEYPNAEIKLLHCRMLAEAEELLKSKMANFAIMPEETTDDRYSNVPIKAVSDVLICHKKFADRLSSLELPLDRLKNYPLVAYLKTTPSRKLLDNYLKSYDIDLVPKYEFAHASSIIRHAKDHFSLAFLLENSVQSELNSGDFLRINLNPPIPKRYYYLIAPNEKQPKIVRQAIEFITDMGKEDIGN